MISYTLVAFLIAISLMAVFGGAFSTYYNVEAQESTGDNSTELAVAELARDPGDLFLTGQGTVEEELARDPGDLLLGATMREKMMINGTINLEQTIFDAISSKTNTTLTQAITTAEQTVGNNSFAMAAFGGPHGDYLVYSIILGTPGMEFHKVIVDPGTGQVVASQELSHEEWMKMQQMQHIMHADGSGGMMMMGEGSGGPMMKHDRGWK